jgi:hypothetical protein
MASSNGWIQGRFTHDAEHLDQGNQEERGPQIERKRKEHKKNPNKERRRYEKQDENSKSMMF